MSSVQLDNPSMQEIRGSFTDLPDVQGKLHLKFLMCFGRHGARTPIRVMPNIEQAVWDKDTLMVGADHTNINYEVCSLDGGSRPEAVLENHYRKTILRGGSFGGQLTNLGMEQSYQLGQSFKRHYVDKQHFLSPIFSPDEIYVRSTNINRCIETARCIMAGIYGDQLRSNQNEPLKIHVDHPNTEVLYPQEHLHPSLKQMWYKAQHAPDYIPGSAELIQHVKDLLQVPKDDKSVDLTGIKDDLSTRMVHGFSLPSHFGDAIVESISEKSPKVLQFALGGPPGEEMTYLPISSGPLLHMIQQVLKQASENQVNEKCHLYLCHDTTLTAVLVALGIFDGEWPPLCCSITLELYQDNEGKSYVRVLYRGLVKKVFQKADEVIPLQDLCEGLRPFSLTWDEFMESARRAQNMR